MKVKIRNAARIKFSTRPLNLSLKTKTNGEVVNGDLIIDYMESYIKVDVGRELSKKERLDVLKEIFNRLAYRQKYWQEIISMRLRDLQKENDENELTILEEILSYDASEFNKNIDAEQVLCYVKESYEAIRDGVKARLQWNWITWHCKYEWYSRGIFKIIKLLFRSK